MNVRSSRRAGCIVASAATIAVGFVVAPLAAHAEAASPESCRPLRSGVHAERIREEAARGMPSFKRFVMRTRMMFQLDFATEVARLDAERAAQRACAVAEAARSDRVATAEPVDGAATAVSGSGEPRAAGTP